MRLETQGKLTALVADEFLLFSVIEGKCCM